MKNNRLLVYICILLILAIFVQLIYSKKDNEKNIQQSEIKDESEGIIINIDDFYKFYSEINVSRDELEKAIHKFVTEDLSSIISETKENGPEENINYYNINAVRISNMGIESKDDFILIAEDLKNCTKSDNAKIYEIATGFEENYAMNNEYYIFDLIIKFTNSSASNIKCKIPMNNVNVEKSITTNNKDFRILFSANSDLAQIFNQYNGPVKIEEAINTINNFKNNLKNIYDETSLYSINDISRYYSEKQNELRSIGIVSEEDFHSIVYQIKNDLKWKENENNYYKFDLSEKYENSDYLGYKLTFLYNYSENLDVKLYLCKSSSELPNIKISGINGGN